MSIENSNDMSYRDQKWVSGIRYELDSIHQCLNINKHTQINMGPICSWWPQETSLRAHALRRHWLRSLCLTPLSPPFQLYRGGGNRSTRMSYMCYVWYNSSWCLSVRVYIAVSLWFYKYCCTLFYLWNWGRPQDFLLNKFGQIHGIVAVNIV